VVASLGLVTSSGFLVHLVGGYIEVHFHFFVMVIVIALYQDWVPFLAALGYVVLEHGVVGILAPTAVYNHPDAWENPWKWAIIHGAFVLGASIASVVSWRLNEAARTHNEQILSSVGEGILGLDANGNVAFANATATRLLGYEADELCGLPLHTLQSSEDARQDSSDAASSPLDAILGSTGGQSVVTATWRRGDGTTFPIEYVATPVHDVRGRSGAILAFRDISERKGLEEQLRQAQKMDAIGQLAGGVAHDFNNLLTVISGYGELLAQELKSSEPERSYLAEITKAGERATSLTQQLLAFSRRQVLTPELLDLSLVVSDTESMLRRLIGEDIELVVVLRSSVGRVRVDRGQIQQVLLNLAINARDAMPKGGRLTVEVTSTLVDEAYARTHLSLSPGQYAVLIVSDTGCGMDAATRARIFEPFFTTKPPGVGTGLGLSTVYGIVKQSGGDIWVYSEPDRGSTFKVYLPRVLDTAAVDDMSAVLVEAPRGTETILLAEDEEQLRTLAAMMLRQAGYTVLEARRGEEALQLAEQHAGRIHLLLTDVVMPGMSGRELAERLAATYPRLRVLYMSGYTDDAMVRHDVQAESVRLLHKPFSSVALADAVRAVLDAPREHA
jgi:PAS domain S-box-containing protein